MPKHPAASILVDIAKAMSLEYSAFPNCALNIQVYGGGNFAFNAFSVRLYIFVTLFSVEIDQSSL